MAALIVSQRVEHGIPHAVSCRALGVSQAWFYKWRNGNQSPRQRRRAELAAAIRKLFGDHRGSYGSPRITADLRELGWRVSENTVAQLMAEQHLVARGKHHRRSTTRADKSARKAADALGRDFSPPAQPDVRWCGDLTEIPTDEGVLYLASILDLHSRRCVGFALGEHHDAELARAALCVAIAVRGGDVAGVVFHSDQGGEYTGRVFAEARLGPASPSRWAVPGRLWTTRPRSRSTPRWSSNCCAATTSPLVNRPGGRSLLGLTSTTRSGGTRRT